MDRIKVIRVFTSFLAILIIFVSLAGILTNQAYLREVPSYALQGIAQDMFDLFCVVPLLLFSIYLFRKKNYFAIPFWLGAILYVCYTFGIYLFSLHFNRLFLLYCAVFGISFYQFLSVLNGVCSPEFAIPHNGMNGRKAIAVFLFSVAAIFALLWLKEIVPALLTGNIPSSALACGLNTNYVYILDIALLLPGMVIAGYGLLTGSDVGKIFAPALTIFAIIMAASLIEMLVFMKAKDPATDVSPIVFFLLLLIWGNLVLARYAKGFSHQ